MLRFRHLALIFLFLSPAPAADEVPLEGNAFLGVSLAIRIAQAA